MYLPEFPILETICSEVSTKTTPRIKSDCIGTNPETIDCPVSIDDWLHTSIWVIPWLPIDESDECRQFYRSIYSLIRMESTMYKNKILSLNNMRKWHYPLPMRDFLVQNQNTPLEMRNNHDSQSHSRCWDDYESIRPPRVTSVIYWWDPRQNRDDLLVQVTPLRQARWAHHSIHGHHRWREFVTYKKFISLEAMEWRRLFFSCIPPSLDDLYISPLGVEAYPKPKHTLAKIIRMPRISIESGSKNLSWFFNLDKCRELSICNWLKCESKKWYNHTDHKYPLSLSLSRMKKSILSISESDIHYQYRCSNHE